MWPGAEAELILLLLAGSGFIALKGGKAGQDGFRRIRELGARTAAAIQRRRARALLKEVARSEGLALSAWWWRETALRGVIDGRAIAIAIEHHDEGEPRFTVEVGGDEAIPSDLRLLVDLGTGAVIEGDEELGLTLLEANIRDFREERGTIGVRSRTIRLDRFGSFDRETMTRLLERARTIAELSKGIARGVPAVLFESAFDAEAPPDVRHRSARFLLRRHASSSEAKEAIDLGLGSSDPRLRFLVACHAGERGEGAAESIIFTKTVPDDLRRTALDHLMMNRLDLEAATRLLSAVLEARSASILHEHAVWWMVEKHRAAAPAFLIALAPKVDGAAARAIARSLGRFTPGQEIERCLIRLAEAHDESVAAEAARALGAVGGALALPALRSLLDRSSASSELRSTAQDALRGVRARIPGDAIGQLAIARATDDGRLSVAPEQGALAVPTDKDG
jgi:HEAT repeat protein